MSDWSVVSEQDEPIKVTLSNGRKITLNREQEFATPNACEMLDFLQRRDPSIPLRENTSGWLDSLLAAGRADGCVGPDGEFNVTPNPGVSNAPAAEPPPEEGDSATSQGAPDVPGGVRLNGAGTDGTGAETPPGQGGTRPREEEPRDHPLGQSDANHSAPEPAQRIRGGDPIDLFSGSFTINETDLSVETAALSLEVTRIYRSGRAYYGPLGWGWDHNHNSYIRELADGSIAHWTGRLQESHFIQNGASFDPPFGVFEVLERLPGPATRYRITASGGHVREYFQPAGWAHAERIPLIEQRDRHGNRLIYTYNAAGRLAEVRDDDNRFLRLTYGECGLLERMEDHAGRAILYEHDPDIEHLICVREANGDVHRTYRYDDPWLPEEFRHNIIEVADGNGNTFVQNEYEKDPSVWGWGRVVRQRYGDFLYQLRYTQLQHTPIDPLFLNMPSARVEVMDPEFSVTTSTFNSRGDLLDYRFRLVKDRSFRVIVHQFGYDSQGNRNLIRYPDGREEHRTYNDTSPNPRARGLMTRREMRARTGFPAPSRIMWRATYEPTFQLPRTVVDEAGNTTTYRYDLDGAAPGATGRLERIEQPDATLPDGTIQISWLSFELNARGQITAIVTGEGMRTEFRYGTAGSDRGLLSEVRHDSAGLDLGERFTHDAVGDIISNEDPKGATREFVYDARRNLVRTYSPIHNGVRSTVSLTRDRDGNVITIDRPRGDYTDPTLGANPIRDVIRYNVLGHIESTTFGVNTDLPREVRLMLDFRGQAVSARDANGQRVLQSFDERGMLLSKEAQGANGTRLREEYVYDVAGRRSVSKTGPLADIVVSYDYGPFGRLRHINSANGSVVTYTWGDDDLLAEETVVGDPGNGVPRLLRRTRYTYDERGRMICEIRSSFRDNPSSAVDVTVQHTYDRDNNRVAVTDGRGATTRYIQDALGRLVETVDPVGNRVVRSYDGLDMIARVEHYDIDSGGTIVRSWTHQYDGRGRMFQTTDPLGNIITTEYDDRDVAVAITNPNGIVEQRRIGPIGELLEVTRDVGGLAVRHAWTYDAAGRMLQYIDPMGVVTQFAYDGVGRRTLVSRPGFSSSRTFGADGRLRAEKLSSGAEMRFSYDSAGRLQTLKGIGAANLSAVPSARFTYDGLDQLVAASVGGSVTLRSYDSFGRLIAESRDGVQFEASYDDISGRIERWWPDGRRERIATAANGFPISIERIRAGGLGNDGVSVAKLVPSGPSRVARVELQANVTATAAYDMGGKLTRLTYAGPAATIDTLDYRFDRAGRRRFEQARGRGFARLWSFDDIDRVTRTAEGFAPPLAGAPAADQAAHDADISTVTAASAAAVEHHQFTFNEGDERLRLARTGAPVVPYTYLPGHRLTTAGVERIGYNADGVRAQDSMHRYAVDAFSRVTRIEDIASGAGLVTISYDALGRPAEIVSGGVTTRYFYFGEEVLLETENGVPSRQYSAHPLGGAPLAIHRPGITLLPLTDLSGSRFGCCDAAGRLLEAYAYQPFGIPTILDPAGTVIGNSAISLEPVFGGIRWLPSAGLYLARARLYDPRHGVFLSPDPQGAADSCNPYAYARHNPADYVDPEGELAFLAVLGIMAVGAVVAGAFNATRQGIAIAEGAQPEFSWSELGLNMFVGSVLAPVAVVAPEVVIPFVAMGVANGATEISRGHYATGLFDIGASVLGARGAVRSPSFRAPLSVRVTNAKLAIARTDLNQAELGLLLRRTFTRNAETRGGLTRQIGEVRIARGILDDPALQVRTYDPATKTATERPLGFDPAELGWDGVRRGIEFYRPNGKPAGDLDISLPRADIEIKLGAETSEIAGKVNARNTFLPTRAGLAYYLASEVPPEVLARWQTYPRAVPGDIRAAARNSFDGHLQVTPKMRGGLPYFLSDLVSPLGVGVVFPSVGTGRK